MQVMVWEGVGGGGHVVRWCARPTGGDVVGGSVAGATAWEECRSCCLGCLMGLWVPCLAAGGQGLGNKNKFISQPLPVAVAAVAATREECCLL